MAAVAEATPVAQVAEAQLVAAHVVVHAVDAAVARAVALARGAGWDRSRVLEAVKRAWEG